MHTVRLTAATIVIGTAATLNIPSSATNVPAPDDESAAATTTQPPACGSTTTAAHPGPADSDYDAYMAFRKTELSRLRACHARPTDR